MFSSLDVPFVKSSSPLFSDVCALFKIPTFPITGLEPCAWEVPAPPCRSLLSSQSNDHQVSTAASAVRKIVSEIVRATCLPRGWDQRPQRGHKDTCCVEADQEENVLGSSRRKTVHLGEGDCFCRARVSLHQVRRC